MSGYVVSEESVESRKEEGDTTSIRVTIDARAGCPVLEQRVVRFAPGRSRERTLEKKQEITYVVSGRGAAHVNGSAQELEPGTALYAVPGDRLAVENPGPADLVTVTVLAPRNDGAKLDADRRIVRYADQPSLPAVAEREFRYLVNQDVGCLDVTQFVGLIPPGRAPHHSHTYDEVVYVLEGAGMLHIGEERTPISAGTCIHLPPLLEHCLENTGRQPLRVLGVFHPSGDPASRASEANETRPWTSKQRGNKQEDV